MSTLTEVRENLEEKKVRLQELVKQMGRGRDPGEISRKAEEHQKSAREIHELSQNFIRVANSKFPRYNAFLGNVRERVTLTFHEIDQLARIAEGKAPLPMAAVTTDPVTNTLPAPRRQAVAGQLGAVVAGDVAPPDTSGPNIPAYRPGPSATGVPAGAILAEPSAAQLPATPEIVVEKAQVASLVPATVRTVHPAVAAPKPTDALRERYKQAYQNFVRGSPDALAEAKHGFTELLKDEPNYYLARYWLVKTHIQLGETDAAKRHADTLIKAQPHLQTARDLAHQLGLNIPDVIARVAPGVPAELASTGSAVTPLPGEAATGTPLGASLSLENPVAVLVEWRVGAGLPSGLSRAALIHELPDAKDDSRLVAIFKSLGDKPPRVGPLAAADAGLLSLARTYGAVAAVHGGRLTEKNIPAGLALIDAKKVPAAFVKDELRPVPYNQFVHLLTAAVEAAVPLSGPPSALAAFPRQESATVGAAPAPRLAITRGGRRIEFRYEQSTGIYIRQTAEGRDALDAGDNTPMGVANLIVQKGAPGPLGTNVIVHRGGQIFEARLTRDPEAPLVNARGRPILLNPGSIWVVGERLAAVPPAAVVAQAKAHASAAAGALASAGTAANVATVAGAAKPGTPAKPGPGATLAAAARLSAMGARNAAVAAKRAALDAKPGAEPIQVAASDVVDAGLPPELAADGDAATVASDAAPRVSALAGRAVAPAVVARSSVPVIDASVVPAATRSVSPNARPLATIGGSPAATGAPAARASGVVVPRVAEAAVVTPAAAGVTLARARLAGAPVPLAGKLAVRPQVAKAISVADRTRATFARAAAARASGAQAGSAIGAGEPAPDGELAESDSTDELDEALATGTGRIGSPAKAAAVAQVETDEDEMIAIGGVRTKAAAVVAAQPRGATGSATRLVSTARTAGATATTAARSAGVPAARAAGENAAGTTPSIAGRAALTARTKDLARASGPDDTFDPSEPTRAAPPLAVDRAARVGTAVAGTVKPLRAQQNDIAALDAPAPEYQATSVEDEPAATDSVAKLARSRLAAAKASVAKRGSATLAAAGRTATGASRTSGAALTAMRAASAKAAARVQTASTAGDGGPEPVDDDATYDADPSGIRVRTSPSTLADADGPRRAPRSGMDDARTAAPPATHKVAAPRPPPLRVTPVPAAETEE